MKVVILAGGFGTRLSELTHTIPKPMVPVGGKPIIWHIMERYAKFGHKDFYIALGYKAEIIKDYFLNYKTLNSNFTIDLGSGNIKMHNSPLVDWNVTLVDTGISTMTGGRIKKLQKYIGNQTFLLTYGDGVANIDIDELVKFHQASKKMVTLTAVRPNARFGELGIANDVVETFQEKPQLQEGWINGGFFVMDPRFLDLIDGDDIMLERQPLERAVKMKELAAFKHNGFWQCMDSKRDHEHLEEMSASGLAPWS